jgi:hypothetical protein
MKSLAAILIVLVPILILGGQQDKRTKDCPSEFACMVAAIQGTCLVQEEGKPEPEKLTQRNGLGKRLHAGQSIQCAADGALKIVFCANGKQIEVKRVPPKWYTIPNVPPSEPEKDIFLPAGIEPPRRRVSIYLQLPSAQELRSEIDRLLAETVPARRYLGGFLGSISRDEAARSADNASRGEDLGASGANYVTSSGWKALVLNDQSLGLVNGRIAVVHWNQCQTAVSSTTFVLRWEPLPILKGLTLSLRTLDGKTEVWRKTDVDSRSNRLVSLEARAALKKFAESRSGMPLKLSFFDKATELRFILIEPISPEDEQSLKRELSEVDDEDPFSRKIDRADIFHSYHLYSEEADEYEEALTTSPESADLLYAAMTANCRGGNAIRATELARQLPKENLYWNAKCLP